MYASVVCLQRTHDQWVFPLRSDAVGRSSGSGNCRKQRQTSSTRSPADVIAVGMSTTAPWCIDHHDQTLFFNQFDRVGKRHTAIMFAGWRSDRKSVV